MLIKMKFHFEIIKYVTPRVIKITARVEILPKCPTSCKTSCACKSSEVDGEVCPVFFAPRREEEKNSKLKQRTRVTTLQSSLSIHCIIKIIDNLKSKFPT